MLKNLPKKTRLGSEIEASIRDSFSTILSSIIVGNKNETTGSAYECLVRYMKYYYIWHPSVAQGSSVPRRIIGDVNTIFTGRLKRLRNTLTTDPELKEILIYLATDSAVFISEFIEFFTSQYEEYIETSTFPPEQSLTTVLDLTDLIFE